MKKIFGIIFTLLLINGGIFAQKANGEFEVRTGAYFQYKPVLGKLGEYVSSNLDGSIKGEFDLPVSISDVFEIGVPVNIGFGVNPVKSELLNSMINFSINSGIYGRIKLFDGNFVIQPELDYGIVLFLPEVNSKYPNELNSVYVDQTLSLCLGFRYVPQTLNDGMMEFEFAPIYSLGFENNELAHFLGGKLGVMIRIY